MSYYSGPLGALGADAMLDIVEQKPTAEPKVDPDTPPDEKTKADAMAVLSASKASALTAPTKTDAELVVSPQPGTEALVMPSDLLPPPAPYVPVNNQNVSTGLFGVPWIYVGIGAAVIGGGAWYMMSSASPMPNRRRARRSGLRAKRTSRRAR
jgi:hypothetical protein